ncbi:hypothetical protein F2Q70_00017994 [Brassica cretica]|uniref:TIR domain-containing protein n=1 Tax=Brassica cretica TaxID=69181 RepID=A0A8S9HRY7_BRACR|nr:hypothetical protein F2Q70_00017994 [Brassica cretica]
MIKMNGCNKLEYVNLNFSKHDYLHQVEFSDCKALTGASWNDRPTSWNYSPTSWKDTRTPLFDFTNCLNLDLEVMLQLKTYSNCRVKFSGEEVPSYFTHCTTGTSSSLTIPLLHSSLTQSFLRFRACIVFDSDSFQSPNFGNMLRFKGSFRNCSDSYDRAQDFCADTKDYQIPVDYFSHEKDFGLYILDCQMSQIPLEMNFDHVDIEIHVKYLLGIPIDIKEWGIRITEEDCSSADNRLGNPNTLAHVFEGNMINEARESQESEGEDEVTEPSSKRMRILKQSTGLVYYLCSGNLEEAKWSLTKLDHCNEIQRSLSLGPELNQAIKDSRIAVVIYTIKYASSSWCLCEPLEIVKCREELSLKIADNIFSERSRSLTKLDHCNEIQRSLSLGPELNQAIKDSRIAVVIYTNKYASSSWCLDEPLEIVKCREDLLGKIADNIFSERLR